MLIYFSYFILFAHFFYNTYIGKKIQNQRNISVTDKRLSPTANAETSTGAIQRDQKQDDLKTEKKEQ